MLVYNRIQIPQHILSGRWYSDSDIYWFVISIRCAVSVCPCARWNCIYSSQLCDKVMWRKIIRWVVKDWKAQKIYELSLSRYTQKFYMIGNKRVIMYFTQNEDQGGSHIVQCTSSTENRQMETRFGIYRMWKCVYENPSILNNLRMSFDSSFRQCTHSCYGVDKSHSPLFIQFRINAD